jgi:photosystem II stability/assembly factor-like uncharacterized protein/outer membrane protein OmpA-like peptidoglycan-associated protein
MQRTRWHGLAFALTITGALVLGLLVSPSIVLAAGTWNAQNPIALKSVEFSGSLVGWAVGGNGRILHTTDGGSTWLPQESGTENWLYEVTFTDALNGWAVGSQGVILHTANGGTSWAAQTSGTNEDLASVVFVDASNGWAVGGYGVVLHTDNGGTTWTPQVSGTNAWLSGVTFTDASNGWAVGDGAIRHTTDGGATWTIQSQPGTVEFLFSVDFFDANNGWAVGSNGVILHTSDGGEHWQAQTGISSDFLNSVVFADGLTGWCVGANGTIQYTFNGGASWTLQPVATLEWLYSVTFTDEWTGWAVGDAGTIFATTNSGNPWVAQSGVVTASLNSVYFADESKGWMVGDGGLIVSTVDGGITLTAQDSGTLEDLNSIVFTDESKGWAVGNGGTILRTEDAGRTWITQPSGTGQSLTAICAPDDAKAWVVGTGGAILRTTDTGVRWDPQASQTTTDLTSVCFTSADKGWAVGNGGTILRTETSGDTWAPQASGTDEGLSSVFAMDEETAWAVGTGGKVLLWADTGEQWEWDAQASPTTQDLTSVRFNDATTGWAVGNAGTAMTSTDGGETWSDQEVPTERNLNSVYFPRATQGWAVGDNGTVIHYANAYSIQPSAGAGGSISPPDRQMVDAGEEATFTITPDTGFVIDDVAVDEVSVGATSSHTFHDVQADHSIDASFTVATFTVTATPPTNGTISPAGLTTVDYGHDATYTVTASSGYRVGTVTVDGTPVTPAHGKYVIVDITSDRTIAATFIKVWTITATAPSAVEGTITPPGATSVDNADDSTYTVTPAAGYRVGTVTVDDTPVDLTDGKYVFEDVHENHTIAATFVKTWTITATPPTGGTITPAGVKTVDNSADETYTVTASSGSRLGTVTVDGTPVTLTDEGEYVFDNVHANRTIAATFIKEVTVSATASNRAYDDSTTASVVLSSADIDASDDVTITYTSARFADKNIGNGKLVTVLGIALSGTDVGDYYLMSSTATTSANITGRPVTVTADDANKAHGFDLTFLGTEFTDSGLLTGDTIASVTLISSGAGASEATGTYAIVPSAAVGTGLGNYAISYVNGTLTVLGPYTLTYTAGTGGTITGTTPQTVVYLDQGTEVVATPNSGYAFVRWSDGRTTAARTDIDVAADVFVTAEFSMNTPAAPGAVSYGPVSGGTLIQWAAAARATGYQVCSGDRLLGTTGPGTLSLLVGETLGPNAGVTVVALGAGGSSAAPEAAVYHLTAPVKLGTIRFRSNSSKLSASNKRALRRLASTLAAQGFTSLSVNGYTSTDREGGGRWRGRKRLSTARAKSVKNYLASEFRRLHVGVTITARGYGNRSPVASNRRASGRAKNRRAEILIK